MYALSMAATGTAAGVAFAAAGWGMSTVWSEMTLPLAVTLGGIALAYALHELELIRLPVPGRDWQVPVGWVQGGFYRSAAIFGGTVGFGIFTRVPYASLPILLAWLFVSGNVLYGAVAGLIYGGTRALSIYAGAASHEPDDVVELNQALMRIAPHLHQATGVALAAFATYLIAAPYLP